MDGFFRLLLQRPAEFINPLQAFFDVRHARRVAQTDVVIRTERNAWNRGDLFRFEQPSTEVGGLQAGPGNVWE